MIELRPFAKLGGADHGWLKAKHHFSFGSHYDPSNMGHGALRVWNDDEIASNSGFPAHPHSNMEIITYVREGAITHQDSLGNKGRTEAEDHRAGGFRAGADRRGVGRQNTQGVIRGLDPRIHHSSQKSLSKWMDCRVKPGNDGIFFTTIKTHGDTP